MALEWVAWIGLLLVVALGGHALGQGALSPPRMTDPSSWTAWANGRPPLVAAFAVLGLMVVAVAWYLLAVTVLGVLARLWGAGRLVSVVDVLTLPLVRRSLHAALGISLVGTTVAAAADRPTSSVAIATIPVATVGVAPPGGQADKRAGDATDATDETDPPVMRLLPEEVPDEPPEAAPSPAAPSTAAAASPTSERSATEWEVRPGDHLWSVAARVLQETGSTGDDPEVAEYWLRLIEANGERLVDPANPDLIFPGQVFALPVLSSPGERTLP